MFEFADLTVLAFGFCFSLGVGSLSLWVRKASTPNLGSWVESAGLGS